MTLKKGAYRQWEDAAGCLCVRASGNNGNLLAAAQPQVRVYKVYTHKEHCQSHLDGRCREGQQSGFDVALPAIQAEKGAFQANAGV